MNITDVIILLLVVIDVVSLSMVTFIFRWARKAMENFKLQVTDLLSGENEESVAIIEKLGHVIYQKLYRYFNIKGSPNLSQSSNDDIPENSDMPIEQNVVPGVNPASSMSGSMVADLIKKFTSGQLSQSDLQRYGPMILNFLRSQNTNIPVENQNGRW